VTDMSAGGFRSSGPAKAKFQSAHSRVRGVGTNSADRLFKSQHRSVGAAR
jgi:hypothetical protein